VHRFGARLRAVPGRRRSIAPRRLVVLFAAAMVGFGALGTRLILVQAVEAPAYVRLAAAQRQRTVTFPARRGSIFDRIGQPLAISVDVRTIYTDPALVRRPVRAARLLAPILHQRPALLEMRLRGTRPGSRFEYLARQVDPKVWEEIKALDIAGIYARDEAKRFYPNGSLASHLLGFTNLDGKGAAGLELQYDEMLRGRAGEMAVEQDPSGRALPQARFIYNRAEMGRSLYLTIDKEIQYFTELTLERAVHRYNARAATAIVMRPSNGEILALANVPDYDPNRYWDARPKAMRNRAVTDVYEPGSAYKIVTAAASLEEEAVTPQTSFYVPDSLAYADRVFHDSHYHAPERMSVTDIIEQSSNVGTIKMGLKLGGRDLISYVRRFGFGTPSGLDFPGEARGLVPPRRQWSGTTIATIPLGQGVAVTPLQMAAAYATVANDGVWVEPRLVYGFAGESGSVVAPPEGARQRVVSARTARRVTRMLVGVVGHGTGLLARVPGYQVAGKTGTAQKPLPRGGYGDSYVGSFGGFAPAGDPRVVVMTTVDDPDPIWGGETAAPTFKSIIEFSLRELGVSPSGNAERAARRLERDEATIPAAHD
jgi:cell division protein FtsI (penicillin-binding protein 3)